MTASLDKVERRAQRLLRAYPKSWRERYGDEFVELLVLEFHEQPSSWRRTMDVVAVGGLNRLVPTGLVGQRLESKAQTQASMASIGCALAAFLACGIAMWSQLTIGWQWSRPDTVGTTAAMVVMSVTVLAFCALGLTAVLPIAWSVLRRYTDRQAKGLVRPTVLVLGGMALLIVGGRHFGNGWPGTGGHPWSGQGIVPGGVAAFTWASTLFVSAYWMHPGALSSFPTAEVAWMVVSPMAIVCVVVGALATVRRIDLSPTILRFELRLASVATCTMVAFLTGCCFWIIDGGTGPRSLFHIGAINCIEVVVMGLALASARLALRRSSGPYRIIPFH